MNTTAKALLIPVAAFAVTVTGAQAFNSEILEKAGLSETQIEAFEEARELREEGDHGGARDVLVEAGIDMDTMHAVRDAMHEERDKVHSAIDEAVANEDYDAFQDAIEGSPLADIITSKDDFKLFVEAHNLRAEGEHEAAREIMDDLGFEPKQGHHKGRGGMRGGFAGERMEHNHGGAGVHRSQEE